ncbi:sel1 repeat family protein [Mesorhizobium sp.]|uniref:sel1 repeat family protein n=1 Tax=Mesorhizobium sp. TaxID=1871066 RepID=UPI000FE2DE08|nr:sel1 repeat family protein [Mesorhizobium sp.]RWH71504.1 MAG: sel1 repeat family protein [Mesorhizobium sp.]RWL30333.1 MAG: sel1 repeat family protein [Mesorhizobium sp.]RWL32626.1 MAG: sel1 repeat family protein [Mesorhizobium sp.]RWL39340.1 MAG: sel1 repeat family protein [Mesorhizobium sp.]RWL55169.1 MAG: sel1 repeat family protein [Mesorhizobium sp.]
MLRPMHALVLSCLALTPLAGVALGAQASSETSDDAAKKAADDTAKKAALAEAISVCDKGAAVPLDPEAKAPPVQYGELFPQDFDLRKLKTLADKCQAAMLGAPQEKRLTLEWLRVQVALNQAGLTFLLPQIKLIADGGSPEANYLLYELYSVHRRDGADAGPLPVSRGMALEALQKAGAAGHLTALETLLRQYIDGPLLRRDAHKVVETAQRVIDAPAQGQSPGEWDSQFRAAMPLLIARTTLENDGFAAEEQQKALQAMDADTKAGTTGPEASVLAYIKALRLGRGTQPDAAKARQLLEARVASDQYAVPMLADMLAKGEGGPADGKRAIAALRAATKNVAEAGPMLAGLLLDGKFVGRQPREAIRLLNASSDLDASIRLAKLLPDYDGFQIDNPDQLIGRLSDAAEAGEPGAALELARLQLSDDQRFKNEDVARAMLKPLADAGDRDALWLYASTQYANLDSTSYRPSRRDDGLSDDQLKALIDEGEAKKEQQAYLLHAKLLRKGVVYPQDDQKATAMLINAANLGGLEAMVLLGDAYDDGLGVDKNPRERLHAWREAARLGSLTAKSKLANAFTFDSFDHLMTLREGITDRIALYNDGIGRMGAGVFGANDADMELSGLFSGPASSAGNAAIAAAVMDAFREAPAGLDDDNLVGIGKALPDDIRVAIETTLKSEGFYTGEPKGYFGPDARKALAAWVDAKGPLGDAPSPQAAAGTQQATPAPGVLDADLVNRIRDKVFAQAQAAKTDKQKLAAIKQLGILARYGDLPSRWVLVRNYHQARAIRSVVTPEEITRYALDILVSKPEGVEKPEFEFIFDLTQIAQDRKSRMVGNATIQAIRDDPRLQDPLTLGAVMNQFAFAPDACDSVLAAAKKAGLDGVGSEGCDEDTRSALIAFAKDKGAAGVEAAARKTAVDEVKALDAKAAK